MKGKVFNKRASVLVELGAQHGDPKNPCINWFSQMETLIRGLKSGYRLNALLIFLDLTTALGS